MKLPIWAEPGLRAKWERCLHQNAACWNTRSRSSVKDKLPRSPDTQGRQSKKPGIVRPLQALVSTMMKGTSTSIRGRGLLYSYEILCFLSNRVFGDGSCGIWGVTRLAIHFFLCS